MNTKLLPKYWHYLAALVPFKLRRLDDEFFSFLLKLHDNEHKSYEETRQYQFLRLKELVYSAYSQTEYYKQKFDQAGFHPDHLKSLDDLVKIPMLTKDEVRNFGQTMVVASYKGKIYSDHTSGTSGKPLQVFRDKKTISREWAAICYQWERVGYTPYDGRVEFRGIITSNDDYIYFPDRRALQINLIKLSSKNISRVLYKINKTKYKFFHGYPSGIYKFAKILKEHKMSVNPEALMFGSESPLDWQIRLIEEIFPQAKMIAHYGQTEKIALGAWAKERKYFFIPSYGIVEHLAETGELIATGFINKVMPIIRYRINDVAEGFDRYPQNGNLMLFPVVDNVLGRIDDMTYTNSGEIVPGAVPTFPSRQHKNISASRLIQHSFIDFELIIEGVQEKAETEVKEIVALFKKIYGDKSKITVKYVDVIPTDKSGKFRWIECRLNKK